MIPQRLPTQTDQGDRHLEAGCHSPRFPKVCLAPPGRCAGRPCEHAVGSHVAVPFRTASHISSSSFVFSAVYPLAHDCLASKRVSAPTHPRLRDKPRELPADPSTRVCDISLRRCFYFFPLGHQILREVRDLLIWAPDQSRVPQSAAAAAGSLEEARWPWAQPQPCAIRSSTAKGIGKTYVPRRRG